jgi:hypothetical protein
LIASNLFALAEASASNVHFTNAYLVNVALRAALAAAAPDNSNPFDHVCVVTAAAAFTASAAVSGNEYTHPMINPVRYPSFQRLRSLQL